MDSDIRNTGNTGHAATGDELLPERVAKHFTRAYGRIPATMWAAPGRINLIGEHTDYNDGFALPMALPQRVTVAAAPRHDSTVFAGSMREQGDPVTIRRDELRPGIHQGWAAYVAGVAWALAQHGALPGGADIMIGSDLPAGAGLASSAALECATGLALDELWGLGASRRELAELAQRAENDFVGMPCGIMDQMASLQCTERHALLLDCRDLSSRQILLDLQGNGWCLLVIDTKAPHRHTEGEYTARRRDCARATGALGVRSLRDLAPDRLDDAFTVLDDTGARRVRHVVTENGRVHRTASTLDRDAFFDVGELLTASHRSLRDDFEVSSVELDTAVTAALSGGAAGARMTGGGFGGCAIALVSHERAGAVADAVRTAFHTAELSEPWIMEAVASPGARHVD